MNFGSAQDNVFVDHRTCPTCQVEVPPRTGRYCPACGSPMEPDAAPREPAPSAAASELPASAPASTPAAARAGAARHPLPGLDQPATLLPIAFAAAGALIGALLWAGIACATGMEIGYVAWAVGGLVGGGMLLGGGRGRVYACIAAGLALAGILGGKYYGAHLLIESHLAQVEATFDRPTFDRVRAAAAASEDPPAAPMGEIAMEPAEEEPVEEEPAEVEFSAEEAAAAEEAIAELQADMAANELSLARVRDSSYTFEKWREEQRLALRGQIDTADIVSKSLGFLDLLFLLLGVSTAFGIVQRDRLRTIA